MSATTNMHQPTYDMISFVVVVTLFFDWSKSGLYGYEILYLKYLGYMDYKD
jgi:hypothetical protein